MSKESDIEEENLMKLQSKVTNIMLGIANGEESEISPQQLNAMTKHLQNNDINIDYMTNAKDNNDTTAPDLKLLEVDFKELGLDEDSFTTSKVMS